MQRKKYIVSYSLYALGSLFSINTFAESIAAQSGTFMPNQGTPYYQSILATGESVSNLGGGLRTGTEYNGLAFTKFALNGSAISLPAGGRFRVSALAIASEQPGTRMIGDFQGVSNIEARPDGLLYDIWYRQDFSMMPLQLRFGIIDMNEYFDVTDSASNLLNSSFGVDAAISGNAALSIYPKPGVGMTARYGLPSSRILLGIFSGNPADRTSPFHSGNFSIGEWQQSVSSTANFKLGAWQCGCTADPVALPKQNTYGLYSSIEYRIGDNSQNLNTVFLRIASSHGATTIVPESTGIGINSTGFFTTRPNDIISAGITQAQLKNLPAETSYELTYIWRVNPYLSFQPDLQFIHNPSGSLPNAKVLIFRFAMSYDTHYTGIKHRSTHQ